jgi:blocked-early-in-transport protein 1
MSSFFIFCVQDTDFDGTTGLLSGSMKRINNMVSAGKSNRRLMCYLILILVVMFFILFYLITWLRSGS